MEQPLIKPEDSINRENILISLWLRRFNSKGTVELYSRTLKEFMAFSRASSLKEIRPSHINIFLSIQMKKLSPQTVRLKRACLSSAFSAMVSFDYLDQNPVEKTDKIRVPTEDVYKIIPQEIAETMISFAQGADKALIFFLYVAFMRISEVINLKNEDFIVGYDFVDVIVTGKGEKKRRIKISRGKYDFVMRSIYGESAQPLNPKDHLFKSRRSGKISRSQAFRRFKSICEKCGLNQDISPHWGRHSGITHSLKKGASLKSVQRMAGHSSIDITALYQNIDDETPPSDFLNLKEVDTKK